MKARAIALAALMILSIVAGSVAFAGGAAGTPAGFVGVPGDQVYSDLPSQTPMGQHAQKIADAGVMASDHEDSLEVIVTSPGRAKNKIDGGEIHGSGPISIVLTDDQNAAGRTVALPAEETEAALGYQPEMARGTHEDGTPWNAEIEYQDGWMLVDVPHFSTNTVTFSGEVNIGQTFTDGSQVSYDISDHDAVSDPQIEFTGTVNTEWDNESVTGVGDGGTFNVSVGGNLDPTNTEITLNGYGQVGGDELWKVGGADSGASVAVDRDTGTVYFGDTGGLLSAFNSDGSLKWEYQTPDDSAILQLDFDQANDELYFGVQSGTLRVVNIHDNGDSASKDWEYTGPTHSVYSLDVDESTGDIYAGDGDGNVFGINPDGSEKWSQAYDTYGVKTITAPGNGYVYSGGSDDNVKKLDPADGTTVTTFTHFSGQDVLSSAFDSDTGTLYVGDNGDNVTAIDESEDTVIWQKGVGGRQRVMEFDDSEYGVIYAGGYDNQLNAISPDNGSIIWSNGGGGNTAGVAVNPNNEAVYTAFEDSSYQLYAYSAHYPLSEDPAVDIDSDGSDEVSYAGALNSSATHTESVDLNATDYSMGVSTTSLIVDVDVTLKERSKTDSPSLEVNDGNWINHTGELNDGETASYALDSSALREGTNTINASMPSLSADAPPLQVGVSYTHDAQDTQSIEYDAEKFSERYSINKTYADDNDNANLTIPFESTVVSIRDLTVYENDTVVEPESTSLDGNDLTVEFGNVPAGESVSVETAGSKVAVNNGSIDVISPSLVGEDIDSKVEIAEQRDDFYIDVSGIDTGTNGERLHYMEYPSWAEADPYAAIDADGNQQLYAPNAINGSETRIRSLPMWVEPKNDVQVQVLDADTPRFALKPGTIEDDLVQIEYRDTVSGEVYELRDITNGRAADMQQAESPVVFDITDDPITYEILLGDLQSPTAGPIAGSSDGSDTPPLMLIGAVLLGLIGLVFISRGIGGVGSPSQSSTSRSWDVSLGGFSLPSIPRPSLPSWVRGGTDSRTSQVIVLGGLAIIGIVALEIASPDSLYHTLLVAWTITTGTMRELFTIFVGIGALIGLWYLDQRTTEAIPTWLTVVAAVVTVIYLLETIQPGVLLGPVSEGFETISPLFWLVLLGGGAYLVYGWIQSRRSPDTQVTLQLQGDDK